MSNEQRPQLLERGRAIFDDVKWINKNSIVSCDCVQIFLTDGREVRGTGTSESYTRPFLGVKWLWDSESALRFLVE